MNAPSPPIERMLREYLLKLPAEKPLPSGDVMPPPDETLTIVKEAIAKRNLVTHTGSETTIEFVDQTLEAVSDILRLLDYHRGHEWATEYMSHPFAVSLGLRERDEHRFYNE
jgi:hypothetical protein